MDCSLPQGSSASSQDPRCFDHIHNHLDNPARNTHPPVITWADSDLGERRWHGWSWHTSDIPSTILIHVGSLRVPVCNAVRGTWTMSWHISGIPSSLLIYVGMPYKRVYHDPLSGYQKTWETMDTERSTRHEPNGQNPRTQPAADGPKPVGMGTPRHPPPFYCLPSAGENRVQVPKAAHDPPH